MNVHTIDLATVIADMHRQYPAITLQMRQSTSGVAGNIAGLRDGSLDIALVAGVVDDLSGITLHPIHLETLVLCTASTHPLAGHRFRAADLDDVRFIDFPPGWGIRGIVDTLFPERRPIIEVSDQIFALELAANDFGVTLSPRSVATRATGIVYSAAAAPIPWTLAIAYSARRTPSNAARTVIEALHRS